MLELLGKQAQYKHFVTSNHELVTFLTLGFLIGQITNTHDPYDEVHDLRLIDVTKSCLYLCQSVHSCYFISTKQHQNEMGQFINVLAAKHFPKTYDDHITIKFCKGTRMSRLNSLVVCKTEPKSFNNTTLGKYLTVKPTKRLSSDKNRSLMSYMNKNFLQKVIGELVEIVDDDSALKMHGIIKSRGDSERYFSVVLGRILALNLKPNSRRFTVYIGSGLDGHLSTIFLSSVSNSTA